MDSKEQFYNIIDKIIKHNKVSHAYLIEVDNYDDDYQCVLNFVKLILCNKEKKCSSCLKFVK